MFSVLNLNWFQLCSLPLLLLLPLLIIIRRASIFHKTGLPPSPPKLPFIGNLHQLGSLPHRSLRSLAENHGPIMLLQLGQVPTLVVSSADAVQEILKTHDHIFGSRPSLKVARILLYGSMDLAFSPYGEHWRQLRKLCTSHLLTAKMLQSYQFIRKEEAALMISKISSACLSPGVVNMSEILNLYANNILCRVVFGRSFSGEGNNDVLCKLTMETMYLLTKFCVEDHFPSLRWLDLLFGVGARAKRALTSWDAILGEIMNDVASPSNGKGDSPKSSSFLDVLLDLQKDANMGLNLNRDLIRTILLDMIAAGTEAPYIVIDWSMTELIRNPQTMKRLQDEVRGIAEKGSMVREEDISRMSYLKAVVKEVLRLHPPGPLLLPRESMNDCELQGYRIPKGARVLVNAWAVGRDPKSWVAAEEFRPERFLGSSIDYKGHDFQFIPFGAGRRSCPGMLFGVSIVEFGLANLVHLFDWKLPDGMKAEELNMDESSGLTARRNEKLLLAVEPAFSCKMFMVYGIPRLRYRESLHDKRTWPSHLTANTGGN